MAITTGQNENLAMIDQVATDPLNRTDLTKKRVALTIDQNVNSEMIDQVAIDPTILTDKSVNMATIETTNQAIQETQMHANSTNQSMILK